MQPLQCPLCESELQRDTSTLHCSNGHSFDKAKQGYFNLLPVQFKRSKSPGDDKQMVAMRQQFLDAGHYQPISENLNALLLNIANNERINSLIDIGCGEGYYTCRIQQDLQHETQDLHVTGLDISKPAILKACQRTGKQQTSIDWLVASNAHLPVFPQSIDLLVSLFTPLHEGEMARVLTANGKAIIASTGPTHLIELRHHLYEKIKTDYYKPLDQLTNFKSNDTFFNENAKTTIKYLIKLDDKMSIKSLLAMTPHFWRATQDKKEALYALDTLTVTVDINFLCLEKQDNKPTP